MKHPGSESFKIDDWRVSPREGLLTRGNETVRLEPKAMEVLVYFASRPGEVITREELERDVWHGALVGYEAVTNTVIKLRKALQDNARQPRFITTVPKVGYQLIAPVTYPGDNDSAETTMAIGGQPTAGTSRRASSSPAHKYGIVAASLAVIVLLGLIWLWPGGKDNHVATPSILVLPFENLGDDPTQHYLADGITEDIITDLSRLSNIMVIAGNSSSRFKEKPMSAQEIGTDINVMYVLKGSVRRLSDKVRVNVQLVNVETGFNAWAQRYDRTATEMFAVQDNVTQRIVEALAVNITSQEKQRLAQRATDNLKAYDLFQEGQRISKASTKESNEQARAVYREAIELDPRYGRAYGALAITLADDFRRGWTDTPLETLDRALELAEQAVALDNTTPQTYWALAYVHLARKEYEQAEQAVSQAITIAPNYADGYGLLALIKVHLGQAQQAVEINTRAMRLNPYYTWNYLYTLGSAYYMLGDYQAAIDTLEQAQARNENAVHVKLYLAASYQMAGRHEDARWTIEQVGILSPTTTLRDIEKALPIADPEFRQNFLQNLRKAGLPN
ncbi:MAG: winged helix-turn-helix domain-containing protein [Gammaproteobacteria bacterium]|jgi:TolB-like protein/DNA-binding winged helix-turn-helix (wHTH) protein